MLNLAVPHKSFRSNLGITRPIEPALIFRYKPTGKCSAITFHLPHCSITQKWTPRSSKQFPSFLSLPYPPENFVKSWTCMTTFPSPGHLFCIPSFRERAPEVHFHHPRGIAGGEKQNSQLQGLKAFYKIVALQQDFYDNWLTSYLKKTWQRASVKIHVKTRLWQAWARVWQGVGLGVVLVLCSHCHQLPAQVWGFPTGPARHPISLPEVCLCSYSACFP